MTENNEAKTDTKETSEEKSLFWRRLAITAPIIVALIGCMAATAGTEPFATWMVGIFSLIAYPTPTVTPTFTLTSDVDNIPTSTASTQTAIPTPATITSPISPVNAGGDWKENCISTTFWQPYIYNQNIYTKDKCFNLVEWGLAANKGDLTLIKNEFFISSAEDYGIITKIKSTGILKVSVQAYKLENSEIWIGILSDNSLRSKGFLLTIQEDDNIDIRPLPSGSEIINNMQLKYAGGEYNIIINLENAKFSSTIDQQKIITDWPLEFSPGYLFLGYRSLPDTEIDARIFNLILP